MNTDLLLEQMLRWRQTRAENEAPRAPRGAYLLELARPWWEVWPERFQLLLGRVRQVQIAYGHALAEPRPGHSGHPVPALIVRGCDEVETSAQVLYFNVRDGQLRFRFQLGAALTPTPECFEVTFVTDDAARPLLSARAALSVDHEYRLDAEISAALAKDWEALKVTDKMPFRMILRTDAQGI